MRRVSLALSLVAFAACSSSPSATIQLLLGGESDTLTRTPAPTTLLVEAIDADGGATQLSKSALPVSTVDLGDQSQDTVASIRVSGLDGNNAVLVRGASIPVQLGGLDGTTLDLFIQRTGELARFPSPLADARAKPILQSLIGRYIFVAGGTDASLTSSTQIYDLATFLPATTPPTLPVAPRSIAFYGTSVVLINDAGATVFELSDSSTSTPTVPTGGTFGEVSGGATIIADDGTAYVVGATRSDGDPTARVLHVDGSGNLTFLALTTPRKGAAAAWVVGRGLVVAGGSATGAGIEVLGPTATNAVALSFPTDATTGAGATALDDKTVLVAGGVDAMNGDAKIRAFDLSCAASCMPTLWTGTLGAPLAFAQSFTLGDGSALVVGDDVMGVTHVARVSPMSVADVPLKAARSGARATVTATGAVAIVGGGAQVIETFVP